MISTVVVTFNEAGLLKDCLASVVQESDEIVILDLGSEDDTLKIAKSLQAKIFTHARVEYVEGVRDFAVAKAKGDWILVLDPDERMTPNLWKKLKEIISDDKYVAVKIPRKNIFFGHWIAHTNWWPDQHVRFFKKGKVSWLPKIHLYPKVDGQVLELSATEDLAMVHYGYQSVNQFINRQSRYATIKAQNLYDEGMRFSWVSFFGNPVREFLVRYIRHLGFLDHFYGFALTYLMMVYQIEVQIKLWELKKNQT
ncbi:glycosyltransferase family 2 protein [Candidatus Daviesbacteria bacterium]|nr:glycosyltransferase family 2 protein [Candidatus Daviesbacteria bacterium]